MTCENQWKFSDLMIMLVPCHLGLFSWAGRDNKVSKTGKGKSDSANICMVQMEDFLLDRSISADICALRISTLCQPLFMEGFYDSVYHRSWLSGLLLSLALCTFWAGRGYLLPHLLMDRRQIKMQRLWLIDLTISSQSLSACMPCR